ncbi:DUF2513 domain-containing protein [Parasutterella excrementihominis]|uniref:DUF2513 domain-containing protein n=1 Tax=Parasutterella excrementihominis TaxID=487175 RepID=UPI0027BA1455|nr:DUF2513 domain-containing protein [Parasutterella excrementihominis]
MKRDWNLLLVLLSHFEAETIEQFFDDLESDTWSENMLPSEYLKGKDDKEHLKKMVYGHLDLLIEGEFVKDVSLTPAYNAMLVSIGPNVALTNKGHDLLAALRSKNLWGKVKETSAKMGVELSLETIKVLVPHVLNNLLK